MAKKGGSEIISLMQAGLVYTFIRTVPGRAVLALRLLLVTEWLELGHFRNQRAFPGLFG